MSVPTVGDKQPAARGLRSGFIWTFVGNAFHAAGQWAILSSLAKLGSTAMVGDYAYAMSLAVPIGMFSHLNLRAVLATDVEGRHTLGDYLRVRIFSAVLALGATAGLAVAVAPSRMLAIATMLYALVLAAENFSDVFYGALQRRDRMDQIARSMIARSVLSVSAVGFTLWLGGDLLAAMAALVVGRLVTLLVYDQVRAARGEHLERSGGSAQREIVRTALPLGFALMLVSLTANVPRYAIEHTLGSRELGAFAAAASFITVGSTVVNALGQSATSRLARSFSSGDRAGFRHLGWRLCGLALVLGACGIATAMLIGRQVLALLYRPELADYNGLLIALMISALFAYLAIMLGYVITSTRSFLVQTPLLLTTAAVAAGGSWMLVPRIGLNGAAVALGAASLVQIAGELVILRSALKRMESAL